ADLLDQLGVRVAVEAGRQGHGGRRRRGRSGRRRRGHRRLTVGVDNDGACRLLPEVRLTRDRPVVTFGTDEVVSHCNREATVVVLVKGHRTELGVAQIEGRWGQLKGDVPRVPVGLVPGDLTGHDAAGVTDLEVDAVRVSALLEPGRQRDAPGLVARIAV